MSPQQQVLVVDDNASARFVRAQTLRRAGFAVIEAGTGREALDRVSDGIDLVVCDINLPDMSGLEVARLVKARGGRTALQVLHVSQTETSDDAVARGLDSSSDAYLVEPVGPQVLIATVKSLLRLRSAERQLVEAIARETEARRAAEEANRVKDDFLAMLSHELRTPLNTIMGWVWQVRQGPLSDPVRRAIEAIDRASQLQAHIIRDLTDVSMIERGKIEIDMTPVELGSVVTPVVEDLKRRAAGRQIEVMLTAHPVTVMADASRIDQVVTNICNNALQFAGDGGRITVEVFPEGADAVIRVTDTGQGIAAEFLPHVFERFRQADTGSQRRYAGLGLGLAIVQHLVEIHKGTVQVESEGVGRGTVCTVRIPVVTAADISEVAEDTDVSLSGFRVLVVEDDPEPCELLTRAIRTAGAEVMATGTAADALKLAFSRGFDVILTDIGLPGMDGVAMVAKLRAAGLNVPVIAITAFATAAERARILAAGFESFVAKPAAPGTVVAATARVLKGASTA